MKLIAALVAFGLTMNAAPRPLIGAGENYGAVLDPTFNYIKYLDTLRDGGFNLARVFNAVDSAMFDGANSYTTPLKDDAYFARLKSFVAEAGKRNIMVEVTLFSPQYGNGLNGWGVWNINPMNKGVVLWDRFNTMENADLVSAQDAVVRKTVAALEELDNVIYEICSEPQFSGATAKQTNDWLSHVVSGMKTKHVIVAQPTKASSGCASPDRRQEAWTFFMSGGAIYNHMGESCEAVRYELRNLATFVKGIDMQHMKPNADALRQWPLFASEGYMLEDSAHIYAIYLKGGRTRRISTLLLDLPAGKYQTSWLNPRTGEIEQFTPADHPGGPMKIQTPEYDEDIALKLLRSGAPPTAPQPKGPRPPVRRARPS